ncbi:hypothetical protein NMY27_08690 [Cronobacter dublinensis subsp. beijingensis]|uniref:hypothetical protein n=1 Tax=Cronobacter dublinensis TaxID=413497 RepID=UPI0023DCD24A|nr:hypothetical protein [Cronobacter dublinensis]WEP51243.1 hypothetical protein NMY27_08690 [Cronobacter dublinensis]
MNKSAAMVSEKAPARLPDGQGVNHCASGNEPAKAHHHGASALKWGTFLRQIPATITIPEQYFINA